MSTIEEKVKLARKAASGIIDMVTMAKEQENGEESHEAHVAEKLSLKISQLLTAICVEDIAEKIPLNHLTAPFVSAAFKAAGDMVMFVLGEENTDEDLLNEMIKMRDRVAEGLVEVSTIVTRTEKEEE